MKNNLLLISFLCIRCTLSAPIENRKDATAEEKKLRHKLNTLVSSYNARIGIGIIDIASGDTLTVNNQFHYTMASTYKLPQAIAVLGNVDAGMLSLDQKVHITKNDLHENTWSPLQKEFPKGNIDLTLSQLLEYSVSKSDNNACDILFKIMGGTKPVEKLVHGLGCENISIKATEDEMHAADSIEKSNWSSPLEMARLLKDFYNGRLLKTKSNALLLKLLTETQNSPKRLKGLLPLPVIVAHKTGTGWGQPPATVNDVGLIFLPDHHKVIAIAVFITDSRETYALNEEIIATISKTVYEHFLK